MSKPKCCTLVSPTSNEPMSVEYLCTMGLLPSPAAISQCFQVLASTTHKAASSDRVRSQASHVSCGYILATVDTPTFVAKSRSERAEVH